MEQWSQSMPLNRSYERKADSVKVKGLGIIVLKIFVYSHSVRIILCQLYAEASFYSGLP